jgi:hypothetical protein
MVMIEFPNFAGVKIPTLRRPLAAVLEVRLPRVGIGLGQGPRLRASGQFGHQFFSL